jgi:hypothetical protein
MKLVALGSFCCGTQISSFLEFANHIFGLGVHKTFMENNQNYNMKKQAW